MPPRVADRPEIQRRLAAGESQRAIATGLGVSPRTLGRMLQTPEADDYPPVPDDPVPDEGYEPGDVPDASEAEDPEPVTASQALTWLQAYAERVEHQAQQAYAPWHTLKLVQELSTLMVAVIKELRAHANDPDPDTRCPEINRGL